MQISDSESIGAEVDWLEDRLHKLRKEAKRLERKERKGPSWEPILGAIGVVFVLSAVMVLELFLFSRADGHWDDSERTLFQIALLFMAVTGIALVWVVANHLTYSRKRQKELEPIRQEWARRILEAKADLERAREEQQVARSARVGQD